MDDRELLELAAKAGEVNGFYRVWHSGNELMVTSTGIQLRDEFSLWNPLTDDGDALRLAVKLEMFLDLTIAMQENSDVSANDQNVDCETDPYAATRRAIVLAAAEIGRAM